MERNTDRVEAAKPKGQAKRRAPIYKADIVNDLAHALMKLGKNDFEGVKWSIDNARKNLDQWLETRPEKIEVELQVAAQKAAEEIA